MARVVYAISLYFWMTFYGFYSTVARMSQTCYAAQNQQTTESSIQAEEQSNRDVVRVPTPPIDWDYRCLLQTVGMAMTPEDVEMATALFKGKVGQLSR